jgi:hypothetical protein
MSREIECPEKRICDETVTTEREREVYQAKICGTGFPINPFGKNYSGWPQENTKKKLET